jgi:ABC-type nitrate/sulfonate/bicarbonate transport system substrate-binding protein
LSKKKSWLGQGDSILNLQTAIPNGLAAVITAAVVGATVSIPARALEQVSVWTEWFPWALHAPMFWAIEEGWFKDAALDVEIDDGTGGTNTVQVVAAGSYDIGFTNLAIIAVGRSKGSALRAVSNICRHRGNEVASGRGNVKAFVCQYHGWPYNLRGELIGAAYVKGSDTPQPAVARGCTEPY